jgi:hypothetical protein
VLDAGGARMAGPLVLVLRHHEAAWRSWAVALDAAAWTTRWDYRRRMSA